MKSRLPLALCLSGFLIPERVSAANTRTLSLSLDFAQPQFRLAADYARVTVAGCETLQKVGEPLLPFRTARILLPPGCRVEEVTVQAQGDPVVLDGNWLVDYGRMPVHRPSPGQTGSPPARADQPNAEVYTANTPYPAQRIELVSVQRLAGCAVALVRVFPVQYVPASGTVLFSARLTITVAVAPVTGTAEASPVPGGPGSASARTRVSTFVDNPQLLAEYPPAHSDSDWVGPLASTFDYLLITRSNLLSAFQPLVDRKLQDGLSVRTATVESITNAYAGRDVPEQIRNFIRYAYTNWGIQYVLLGGDTQIVPSRYAYAYVDSKADTSIPCDLYYACLDGSWNSNNNSRWGEVTDGEGGGDVDLLAEVSVGRAPVDTVAEVNTFVEKTVRYETQGPGDAPTLLFVAEFLGSFPTGPAQGGDMFDPLLPYCAAYQVNWLDDRPFATPQWTKADAINAMNQSPHFALFNGHGTVYSLFEDSPTQLIESIDLDTLTNQLPFLAYSVGCDAGQFDNFFLDADCIGEELVKRHAQGAFAAVFNSRVGFYDPQEEWKYSGEFQIRFFDEMLTKGRTNLGVAHQLSKHDMVGHVETTIPMAYRYCYYEMTLFGDPHTAIAVSPYPLRLEATWASNGGSGGDCILRWPSLPNRSYAVYATTNLAAGSFALLTNGLPATPPLNTFSDPIGGLRNRFYRVEVRDEP